MAVADRPVTCVHVVNNAFRHRPRSVVMSNNHGQARIPAAHSSSSSHLADGKRHYVDDGLQSAAKKHKPAGGFPHGLSPQAAAYMHALSALTLPHLAAGQSLIGDPLAAMALLNKPRQHHAPMDAKLESKRDKQDNARHPPPTATDDGDAPLNLCMKRPSTPNTQSSAASSKSAISNHHAAQHKVTDDHRNQHHAYGDAGHGQAGLAADMLLHPRKRGRKPKSLLAAMNSTPVHQMPSAAAHVPPIVVPSGDNKPRKRGRPPLLSPPPSSSHGPVARNDHALGLEGLQLISSRLAAAGALPNAPLPAGWPTFNSSGQIVFPSAKSNGNSAPKPSSSRDAERARSSVVNPSDSDSDNESDVSKDRESVNEEDIRLPLRFGWRRHTIIKRLGTSGIKGEVLYFSPDGKKLKNQQDVVRYITRHNVRNISKDNFSYSSRWLVGEFIEPALSAGRDPQILSESEIINRMDELKRLKRRRNAGVRQPPVRDRIRKARESSDAEPSTSSGKQANRLAEAAFNAHELFGLAAASAGIDPRIFHMLQVMNQISWLSTN